MKSFWWDLHKRAFWFDLICFFLEFFPGESGTLIRGYLIGCFFSSVGENPRINRSSYIYFPERVSVGDNLIMNVSCVIQCVIGAGVILDKYVDLIPYGVYVGNPPRLIKQRV